MLRNLAAWTRSNGIRPPYVSINLLDDGKVQISMRDDAGCCSTVIMPPEEWALFRQQITWSPAGAE